jgi:hypothetical protein
MMYQLCKWNLFFFRRTIVFFIVVFLCF